MHTKINANLFKQTIAFSRAALILKIWTRGLVLSVPLRDPWLAKILPDNYSFSNATRTSCPVPPADSLEGAVRLRLTALYLGYRQSITWLLKKESLPHNQNVFLGMTLNFFSPCKPFAKNGSLNGIDKTSSKIQIPKIKAAIAYAIFN